MVDAIGHAEPLHQGSESDAAGNDEDRRVTFETLERPAQPAQELLDPLRAVVLPQQSHEEDGELVYHQENRLVVLGAVANQPFTVTSPVAGTESASEFHAKLRCADLLDVLAEPATHPGEGARHQRTNWMGGSGDAGDHVLRTGCSMNAQQTGFAIGAALAGIIANTSGFELMTRIEEFRTAAYWLFAGFVPAALVGNPIAWRFGNCISVASLLL